MKGQEVLLSNDHWLLVGLLLGACADVPPDPTDTPAATDPQTDTTATGPTADTARPETGATADTGSPVTTGTGCAAVGSGIYSGPIFIESTSVGCDKALETVRYYACAQGWTGDGEVFTQETGNVEPNWSDGHRLLSYQHQADGWWDELERELTAGASLADFSPDVNTLFRCIGHFAPSNNVLSYAMLVYDETGMPADCLAWGHNPQAMIAGSIVRVNEPQFPLSGCTIVP